MKKYKIPKFIIASVVFLLSTITACKKDFYDINQNPNAPADVSVVELLPSAEAAIAHVVGNNFQIYGGLWGQFWTQSPSSSQYKTFEQYSPSSDDFDRPWKALYADALKDLQVIIAKATASGRPNYAACAKILEGYTFQLLTDNFGDVPFSDALKGEQLVLSPSYDTQKNIYDGIIVLINDGLALIDENAEFIPGSEDLLLGGDMAAWRKFGNTLLLKVYLRLAYVDAAKAQAGIDTLEAHNAEFLGAGEEVRVNYINTGGNSNPLYSSLIDLSFVQNIVASATAIDYMNNNNDPRVDVFYVPPAATQIGIPQGAYTLPAGTPVSLPSPEVGGYANDDASASAPVKLMTGYESLFLQSEAAARGWLTSGSAQTLYEDAITESFASYGVSGASTYIAQTAIVFPSAGTLDDKIKAIITQKWAAMCGNQNDEAWIEWRRTGYPDFFTESVNSIIGSGRFPERFYYPSSEVTRNGSFPGQKLIYQKVWWDVN